MSRLAGMREDRKVQMVQQDRPLFGHGSRTPVMMFLQHVPREATHATSRCLPGLNAPISRVGEPEQWSHEHMLVGQSRPCPHASPSSTCSVRAGIQAYGHISRTPVMFLERVAL